jgi:hypothetical protein
LTINDIEAVSLRNNQHGKQHQYGVSCKTNERATRILQTSELQKLYDIAAEDLADLERIHLHVTSLQKLARDSKHIPTEYDRVCDAYDKVLDEVERASSYETPIQELESQLQDEQNEVIAKDGVIQLEQRAANASREIEQPSKETTTGKAEP